jgi:hypothetical protein
LKAGENNNYQLRIVCPIYFYYPQKNSRRIQLHQPASILHPKSTQTVELLFIDELTYCEFVPQHFITITLAGNLFLANNEFSNMLEHMNILLCREVDSIAGNSYLKRKK